MSMFENPEKSDEYREALANAINNLIDKFDDITEYNQYELKALSLLLTDKYMRKLLEFYINNKRHLNRKYAKEIIELSEIFSSKTETETENRDGFLSRIFNRDNR